MNISIECPGGCGNLSPGTYHTTYTGAYVMQNSAGSQVIGEGQFGFVQDANKPPVILPKDPGLNHLSVAVYLGRRGRRRSWRGQSAGVCGPLTLRRAFEVHRPRYRVACFLGRSLIILRL